MSKNKPEEKKGASQHPSRKELRSSVIWPVVISVAIWIAALLVWIFVPGQFDAAVSAVIGVGMAIYLVYYQRSQRLTRREQILSLIFAIPAIAGITAGLIAGQAVYAITGVSMSLLLLGARRLITTPISYRMARRSFFAGDLSTALDLADKSIKARPDFWETYQLRALIFLSNMQFSAAERDANQALKLRPDAHPALNTVGQVHLATNEFAKAEQVYSRAIQLSSQSALYHYYLGLSLYRQRRYREATEPFATATQLGLPYVTYELQAYYYLARCLEENGETEKAEEVNVDMLAFKEGLPQLQEELANQPDFPHLALLRQDVKEIEQRLASGEASQTPAA